MATPVDTTVFITGNYDESGKTKWTAVITLDEIPKHLKKVKLYDIVDITLNGRPEVAKVTGILTDNRLQLSMPFTLGLPAAHATPDKPKGMRPRKKRSWWQQLRHRWRLRRGYLQSDSYIKGKQGWRLSGRTDKGIFN